MVKLSVNLPSGGYAIHIGPGGIDRAGELVRSLRLGDRILVVSDTSVAALYGDRLLAALRGAGFAAELVAVLPGEESKSLAVAEQLYTKAIAWGLDRKCPIVALGGGVVGDLAGFVAATYLRGVPFIQMPTTLLAQVDSSVGGKVAVNHPAGKNLIGAFHQPVLVVADGEALASVPEREFASGLAEVVKYGVIADPAFFAYLQDNSAAILAREPGPVTEIIRRSCLIKAAVVEQDEKETGQRMVLNFGHTIGHAVEAAAGFSRYSHGEAVAVGMYAAAVLSHRLGLCGRDTAAALAALLREFRLPVTAPDCNTDDLIAYLSRDKKSVGGAINWVLAAKIGQVTISAEVREEEVRRVLEEITRSGG